MISTCTLHSINDRYRVKIEKPKTDLQTESSETTIYPATLTDPDECPFAIVPSRSTSHWSSLQDESENCNSNLPVRLRMDVDDCLRSVPIANDCKYSLRSVSSPQLTRKAPARSKAYRKASLNCLTDTLDYSTVLDDTKDAAPSLETRIINVGSNHSESHLKDKKLRPCSKTKSETAVIARESDTARESKVKWNAESVHITCNPLSTPYPYSTPCHKNERATMTKAREDEPKGRSCGSFLPILSLIPHTVVSFQYLSPKMKFSWWRNKIS